MAKYNLGDVAPSDSISQIGGESSAAGSLAAAVQGLRTGVNARKRDIKAQDRLEDATVKSGKSNVANWSRT
jgi:hypothetical protein